MVSVQLGPRSGVRSRWSLLGAVSMAVAAASVVAPSASVWASEGGLIAAPNMSGQVRAFGANDLGQTDVPAGLDGVTAIATGSSHSVAVKSDGTVVAWGKDTNSGANVVPAGLSGVTAVSAAEDSLALKSDGSVVAWGANTGGQSTVPELTKKTIAIASGDGYSLALEADGTVVGWGDNSAGQATAPAALTGKTVTKIAAAHAHSLALLDDGTVVAWGSNADGESTVPAGLDHVVAVAAGSTHSLALKSDGTVVAWGANRQGQITVPAGLNHVASIAAGGFDSIAVKDDGSVVAWGWNGMGELDGLRLVNNAIAISASYLNASVITADLTYTPLATARVFDGMVTTTPVIVPIANHGGVAPDASAAVVNAEVFQPSTAGYLRVTPAGQDPQVANLQYVKGQTISNAVTVKLVGGALQVKVSAGTARVLLDLSGYYSAHPAGMLMNPVTTTRIFDGTVSTAPTTIQVGALNGPVPAGASAAIVNVEVFRPTAEGYLRVTPAGTDPTVATQEFVKGQAISNLAITKLTNGALQVKLSAGTARVLIDLSGYFSNEGGTPYHTLTTTRVFNGTVGASPALAKLADSNGIASFATAVVVNAEIFQPTATGYLRVTPAGQDATVAAQEFSAGTTISNLVISPLNNGALQLTISTGTAQVLLDAAGYFA